MYRRQLLQASFGTASCVLVSGCIGDVLWSDDEPVDGGSDDLLPPPEQLLEELDGEWAENEEEFTEGSLVDDADAASQFLRTSEDWEADYVEDDPRIETAGEVTIGVWTYEDVEDAREAYNDHPDQRRGFEPTDVADESIVGTTDVEGEFLQARVLFRDTNAVGWVSYWDIRVEDIEQYELTAIDLAETVHDEWR